MYFDLDLHHLLDHTGPFVVAPLCSLVLGHQQLMVESPTLELEAGCLGIVLWCMLVEGHLVILIAPGPALDCLAMSAWNPLPCGLVASH